ncbi:MAG: ABC transporter permease [Anaerolineae bacterium]|nr:ABC transporter permease [Anaerolineae bacterium]
MAAQPFAFGGLLVVAVFIIVALIGPLIAPHDYDDILRGDDRRALKRLPPSADFIMGTDLVGRDVFSRVLWGARETMGLPAIATLLAVTLGTIIGLGTGYAGGWIDEVISRALDSLLAIPSLVLALVMLTTIVPMLDGLENPLVERIGAENISLTIVIVLLYVPIVTRVIRSATLNVRAAGYVEAARLRGESALYIMFREILPSVLPALAVEASLRLSYAIFLVASLGFLGLGVQPPSPEWGRMVLDARTEVELAPWSLWFPVASIALLIISVNLLSDGLRRILRYDE